MRQKIDCNWLRLCVMLLFLFMGFGAIAQKTVTGKVISSKDNLPVGFATVTVKGTKVATNTDANGNFTLNLPAGKTTVVISSVGYANFEADASSGSVNVTLNETTSSLDEIVVTGYTAQKKKDITGAVAVVNVKDLKSVPGGTTESLLQGQAAGVTVINSGSPGGFSNVRIRGITSPTGSSDPLVIVDGVQGSLHDLNPNDIESIQVLKDAGSAAIYGIQGSNGVIVVTTKKGRGGARITYDAYIGTQRPLKNGFDVANTQEYADVNFLQAFHSSGAPDTTQFGNGATPVIPDYITPHFGFEGDPKTDPATYNINSNQITRANKTGTDWFHEIFKPAVFQSHTVSASAGTDKSSYFFSLNYLDQQGTLINTYLKRYQARINTVFNIKNNIRIGENAYVLYRQNPSFTNQNEGNAISMSYRMPAIIPVYDIMGNYAGTKSGGLSNAQNPVAIQQRQADNKGNDWQANGNVFGEVDFLKHFTIRTSFGGNFDNYYYYYFTYTSYENAEGNTNPNAFTEGAGYNSQWLWTNTLTYNNTFGKHVVKALIGSEARDVYQRSITAGRSNYYTTNPNYWTLNSGDPNTKSNTGASPYQLAEFSQFGRIDYNYADKYLISGVLRHDQASVFSSGNNDGNFPSVTAGWRVSGENFMKSITWINDLKIRGSYGQLGSISNINPTNPYSLYASGAGYSYYAIGGQTGGATQGFYLSQFGNTQTTFEKDIITNFGLDATLFNRKLDFSVEVYKKKISGLLFRAQSTIGAFLGGATEPFINAGDNQNTGLDFSGTYHYTKHDLSVDLTGTVTSYKSKVISLPPGYQYLFQGSAGSGRIGAFTRIQPGQPVGEFYGYKVLGFFQSYDDVAKSPTQDGAAPGRFKYEDVNKDGKISDSDRTFFGNPNPKFTYGFNLSIAYKSWDLSAFFYGSAGNKNINFVKYWTDFPQVFGGNISEDAVHNSAILVSSTTGQPTTVADPNAIVSNPGAKVPVLEQSPSFSSTTVFNSYYMEDGSFFKCKQLQIGYTIPKTVLNRFGIDRFRIYIQAANLFTITKYSGLDPELQTSDQYNNSNFGIDFGNYPANQKSYYVGVNLTF